MTSISIKLDFTQGAANSRSLDIFSSPNVASKPEKSAADTYAAKKFGELKNQLVDADLMPSGGIFGMNSMIKEGRINQIKSQMAELKKDYPSVDEDSAKATPSQYAKDTYNGLKMKLIDAKLMPTGGFFGIDTLNRDAQIGRVTEQIKRLETDYPGLDSTNSTSKQSISSTAMSTTILTTFSAVSSSAQSHAQTQYTDLQKQLIDAKLLQSDGFVGLFRGVKINDLTAKINQLKSDYPSVSTDGGVHGASEYAKAKYTTLQKDLVDAQLLPTGGPFNLFSTIRENRINAVKAEIKDLKSNFSVPGVPVLQTVSNNSSTVETNNQSVTVTFANIDRPNKSRDPWYIAQSGVYDIDMDEAFKA
jgi:hypothetical protein